MPCANRIRPVFQAGWICLALLAGGTAAPATHDEPAQLLKHADDIKSSDNTGFKKLLGQLNANPANLSPQQHAYLGYLNAWQIAYSGDYGTAIPQLTGIMDHSSDPMLRFRAGVTAVNVLAISAHNEEAYARLSQLLEDLPNVSDPLARQQGLAVAALLYNQAGQYDLGLNFADLLIKENSSRLGTCEGWQLKLNSLGKSSRSPTMPAQFEEGIAVCNAANEPVWTNLIRTDLAKQEISSGQAENAVRLLLNHYEEAKRTNYRPIVSAVDSVLAQAYWKIGDGRQAQDYAQRAVASAIKNEYTEPLVNAYEVLYLTAQKQEDYQSAFGYLQQYAIASKGYLSETSARAIAYQMVRQRVQEKKQQVDALNKENQVLQLRQQVGAKNAEAGKLLLLLLLTILGSIGLYAYRTKRSQLKFMNLARRDGLTGIFNRQHFIETSEEILAYAAKSVRDASVIVIDLDHFKDVNDNHGHAAGDRVLKAAVAACQAQLRTLDVFGRLGGEEFGILLPDCVPERAADVAEQMRSAVAELATVEGNGIDFPVHASFGVSATRWSGYGLRQLLAHADSALYRAKREGRNRVAIHDDKGEQAEKLVSGILDRRRG